MGKPEIVKIIKKVLPAVVSITISKYLTVFEKASNLSPVGVEEFSMIPKGKKKIKIGGGSGFIIDKSGIILTNRHVIDDPKADYLVILSNGEKYKAEILAKDPINDIAVIKIEAKNLLTIKLGDSSKLELGEIAVAIGNTLGTFNNTVSVGSISGLSRQISATNNINHKIERLRGLIQTDAAINPGNSGGPLINYEGKVIGINAAMVFGAENVGFALPINTAKKGLEELKKFGKIRHPFLGIRYIIIGEEMKKKYHLPSSNGVLIVTESSSKQEAIVPGSPAKKAGLKEGDIITEAGNKKISEENTLEDILQTFKIGEEISLKIIRGKKKISSKIKIGHR